MALDIRLACLMKAINKDWAELEAKEMRNMLIVRIREKWETQSI